MGDLKFSLIGVEQLNAKLDSVSKDIKLKGGRFALRKAANVVATALKQNARALDNPETAESIEKNVAVRWSLKRFKRSGDLMFRVGIMGGAGGNKKSSDLEGLPGKDTRHWRHLEFGSSKNRAQPFARKSLVDNVGAATSEFVGQYNKAIDRAIKRAKK